MALTLTIAGIVAVVAIVALVFWFDGDRSVMRARHDYRRHMAEKVLGLAERLEDHRLWVALPFAELVTDPKAMPEMWEDRPRRWARVTGRDGTTLLLEGGERAETPGCEWYVYADAEGNALQFAVSGAGKDGRFDLPPDIDPETVFPSDLRIGEESERQ